MKIFWFVVRNSRLALVLSVLTGGLSGASNAFLLVLVNSRLSDLYASDGSSAALFAGCCALILASRVVSQTLLIRLSQGAIMQLRMELSRQLLNTPLRQLEELGSPRLLAALTTDIFIVTDAILVFPLISISSVIIAGTLIYMGFLAWPVLLVFLAFMVFGILTYQLVARQGLRHLEASRDEQDQLYEAFKALTEGTKELKLHAERQHSFLEAVLKPTSQAYRDHNISGRTFFAVADGWAQLLGFVFLGLLLFLIQPLSLPTLTGFALITLYILGPLVTIMDAIPVLGRATVSLQKIEDLRLSLETEQAGDTGPLPTDWQTLSLHNVTHSYYLEREGRSFTLGPLNLSLQRGQTVFIIGGNGSGKTTLAKLLIGLYEPQSGQIELGRQLIGPAQREAYRQYFSVIFADFYLFKDLLGLKNLEVDRQAQEYLVKLQLDQKVQVANGQFSTTSLSQGQRKRLALLTAFLEDRSLYLFDEWAADQDPLFKAVFYQELLPALKQRGKTVIVITHDDAYFGLADRLIKLNYGQIDQDITLQSAAQRASFEADRNELLRY